MRKCSPCPTSQNRPVETYQWHVAAVGEAASVSKLVASLTTLVDEFDASRMEVFLVDGGGGILQ